MLEEVRAGLWRWSAPHPAWHAGGAPDSPDDWPQRVGCVAASLGDALVFIDALVPADDELAFWSLADRLAAAHSRVLALTTVRWHRRSRDALVERYGASTSRAAGRLPEGLTAIPVRRAGETMFWLPGHGALVPGDRILGAAGGGLRLCPASWLRYLESAITPAQLREALLPLLELPVEIVLVSHGEPVLAGGHEALEQALGRA